MVVGLVELELGAWSCLNLAVAASQSARLAAHSRSRSRRRAYRRRSGRRRARLRVRALLGQAVPWLAAGPQGGALIPNPGGGASGAISKSVAEESHGLFQHKSISGV